MVVLEIINPSCFTVLVRQDQLIELVRNSISAGPSTSYSLLRTNAIGRQDWRLTGRTETYTISMHVVKKRRTAINQSIKHPAMQIFRHWTSVYRRTTEKF